MSTMPLPLPAQQPLGNIPLVFAWAYRYYNGHVNLREMVGMVREPQNPYDRNAIRVSPTGGVRKKVAPRCMLLAPPHWVYELAAVFEHKWQAPVSMAVGRLSSHIASSWAQVPILCQVLCCHPVATCR
jgi:hypothetical protein